MVAQLQELVEIPSQGGIDDYRPIILAVQRWLRRHRIDAKVLQEAKRFVGIWGTIRGKKPGPTYMVNATVDTAPIGALRPGPAILSRHRSRTDGSAAAEAPIAETSNWERLTSVIARVLATAPGGAVR